MNAVVESSGQEPSIGGEGDGIRLAAGVPRLTLLLEAEQWIAVKVDVVHSCDRQQPLLASKGETGAFGHPRGTDGVTAGTGEFQDVVHVPDFDKLGSLRGRDAGAVAHRRGKRLAVVRECKLPKRATASGQ